MKEITEEVEELVRLYIDEKAPEEYIQAMLWGYKKAGLHARDYSEYNKQYLPNKPIGALPVEWIFIECELKKCTSCHKVLDMNDDFSKKQSICKQCEKIKSKKYRDDLGKEEVNRRNRESYHKRGNKGKTIIKDFQQSIVDNIHDCDNKELLLILKEVKDFLGKNPVMSLFHNGNNLPNKNVFIDRFGSFSKAIDLVNSNNFEYILEKEGKECKNCGNIHYQPKADYCSYFCKILLGIKDKTKKDLLQKGKAAVLYGKIRDNAKSLIKYYYPEKECKICEYDTHVECCHIKDIQDYPDEALITDINSKENLVWLCPNHHYEFDAGIIDLDGNKILT